MRITKLYVGMRSAASRWLLAVHSCSGSISQEICWIGSADDLEGLACALLQEHLSVSAGRVQSLSTRLAGSMRVRLIADFWTLRPSEIDEAIGQVTKDQRKA